jgi:1-acyl-sn-glycerol-3-phosphate acyltransferase
MKRAFGFIWGIWAFTAFMVVVTILTPVYAILLLLFGKKISIRLVWVNYHYASPLLLWLYGIKLKVTGNEKIKPGKAYVFVGNHRAAIDIISSASATPIPARFLAKAEVKYIPLFGYMVAMLGIIVDRKSKESRELSFIKLVETLRSGESIMLYPEGTRNKGSEPLMEFKDGAFRAAIAAQVPIAYHVLLNTRELNNPDGTQLYPGSVTVIWGDPIETTGMTQADLPRLKESVWQKMRDMFMQQNNLLSN